MITRLAWREIRNSPRFTLFFIFNLSLGLFGFIALDAFQRSLGHALQQRSKSLLGGDLSLSARRLLTPEEEKIARGLFPSGTRASRVTELYSMASGGKATRLVQIKAVEADYPYYGTLEIDRGKGSEVGRIASMGDHVAWIYPELIPQLGLTLGGAIKIGGREFRVEATVLQDSTNAWTGASLAPRIFLSQSGLAATGLIQPGSTVYYSWLLQIPDTVSSEDLSAAFEKSLVDPAIQVWTHRTTSEAVGRLMGYLNDYLGLVALVAVFLASVGAGFLFRSYLGRRLQDIAVMASLGLSYDRSRLVFALQLAVLGAAAALPALLAARVALPWLGGLSRSLLPLDLGLTFDGKSAVVAVALGIGVSLAVCFPLLTRVRGLKPLVLLRDGEAAEAESGERLWWTWLPVVIGYWGLAVWQAHSLKVGSLFWAGFLLSGAILTGIGIVILKVIASRDSAVGLLPLPARLALRNLARQPFATLCLFLALGLGMVLANLIPQLQATLQGELETPGGGALPSLFLFDIQDDQIEPLVQFVKREGATPGEPSPFVRARIQTVNGEPFVKGSVNQRAYTREEEREQRFRNRGFNLTFRSKMTASESLVSGREFQGIYQAGNEPAEISVEEKFADRLGFHLGDRLRFDVQGVEIEGKIVNLRKVRWTSFQPNFFIQFQKGAIDEAPKTFLLSVGALAEVKKAQFQTTLVERFPNVSVVDVGRVVARISEILDQMSWALKAMALLSLMSGAAVLYSIVSHHAESRRHEINLLKVVGMPFSMLFATISAEFLAVAGLAAFVGASVAVGFGYFLSVSLFESASAWRWDVPLATSAGCLALCLVVVRLGAGSVFREKPAALLLDR